MDILADPLFAQDVPMYAPYNLPYEDVYETSPYPRYGFDTEKGPPIIPIVYYRTPTLFSLNVSTVESIGALSASQFAGESPPVQNIISLFKPVCLFDSAL